MKKELRMQLKAINTAVAKLNATKIKVYLKVYKLEVGYENEISKEGEFAIENPNFKGFAKENIPQLDYFDYLKYKGFVANGLDEKVLVRISDEALSHIRMRSVIKGKIHPDFLKTFKKLPKKGPITWDIAYKTFEAIRSIRTKTKAPVLDAGATGYTKKGLEGYKKAELINLIMKLQRDVKNSELKYDNLRLVKESNKAPKRKPGRPRAAL